MTATAKLFTHGGSQADPTLKSAVFAGGVEWISDPVGQRHRGP